MNRRGSGYIGQVSGWVGREWVVDGQVSGQGLSVGQGTGS